VKRRKKNYYACARHPSPWVTGDARVRVSFFSSSEIGVRTSGMKTTSIKLMARGMRRTILEHSKGKPCLLCGRRAWVAAAFFPKNQQAVGAPTGKLRSVCYTLCKKCYRSPNVQDRVEKRIFADLAAVNRVN
jgi:hypothetical protein